MRRYFIILQLFAIMLLFLTISCKKSIENKIDGKWRRINVVNVNSGTFEDWEFDNGYLVILEYSIDGSTIDTLSYSSGEYSVKTKFFKRILSIKAINNPINSNLYNYIGDWTIDKLTKKYLTLVTTTYGGIPGGQTYREFKKN